LEIYDSGIILAIYLLNNIVNTYNFGSALHFHILQYGTKNLLETNLELSKLRQILLNKTSLPRL